MFKNSCIVKFKSLSECKVFLKVVEEKTEYIWSDGIKASSTIESDYKSCAPRDEDIFCIRITTQTKKFRYASLDFYKRCYKELPILNCSYILGNTIVRF
jgi:hypothetical protein